MTEDIIMKPLLTATIAALTLGLGTAQAHEFEIAALSVDHPMAYETAPTAHTGGGYMTITNTGDTADRLLAVKVERFDKVMLHESKESADGMASMSHIEAVDIPAGETVTFQPGGLHVMFMGLGGDPLEVGETIPAILVFEKAGELAVDFNVEARDGASHEDHSDHSTE